jgi:endoribonuclease LACTB2
LTSHISAYCDSLKIINVGYRSVNCYLLITEKAKLLIDVGWPGEMQELKWSLAQNGFSVKEVTHVLVTHHHMDHGAIAQEMKGKGAKLIVMGKVKRSYRMLG